MKTLIAATAAALIVTAAATPAMAAPVKKAAAPAARDWTRLVAMTPAGGFRMGNPAAKVKLVEYGSMTCSHCAHFDATGSTPLIQNYVKTGKVAFEFRNYIRDPFDIAAALTARCGGPTRFFGTTHQLFATQADWMARLQAVDSAKFDALKSLPAEQQIYAVARFAGFDAVATSRGIPAAQYKACVANKKNIDQLVRMESAATFVKGTPTFTINGQAVTLSGADMWTSLEGAIKAAL